MQYFICVALLHVHTQFVQALVDDLILGNFATLKVSKVFVCYRFPELLKGQFN